MGNLSLESFQSLFTLKSLKAAGAGALGALLGTLLEGFTPFGSGQPNGFLELVFDQAMMFMVSGAAISVVVLIYDNSTGMRGRWNRDLAWGVPLFAILAFICGALGQTFFSIVGISRSIPWAFIGAGVGAGIGLLRRDKIQAQRGALGGAIGGLLAGLLIDGVLALDNSLTAFAMASQWGTIIMGALIALFMGVVQDALKTSWLLGVSAGPYEGREYLLNTAKVTVGRSEASDIALYRLQGVPQILGAFVNENGAWSWQGEAISINGVPQTAAKLQPGDTIQFGDMFFRYQTRAFKDGDPTIGAPASKPAYPFNPPQAISTAHFPTPEEVLRMGSTPITTLPDPASPVPPPVAPPAPAASQPPAPRPVAKMPDPARQAGPGWSFRGLEHPSHTIVLPAAPAQATIGRAPGNSIVIDDQFISSQHARLTIGANMLTLTDLGSTNGSAVNGQPCVPEVRTTLRAGDHLQLGHREYVVELS